ncbi:hypothetical protein [Amycolatopsis sp. WAC 04182]|uniref:hypothetical protein n=1 Tax=Amycolatopsis sp. WAC 04182 TaxID=2203198 RepID=UPI001F30B6A4|nr:hypothetical protein [Amycolatopsis sp. WAC 04182]
MAQNSVKSYDLLAADGFQIQVKARTVGADTRTSAEFSAFRPFAFDVAVLITPDSDTYALLQAREVPAADLKAAGRHSDHVNGRLIPLSTGLRLGVDVPDKFHAALST